MTRHRLVRCDVDDMIDSVRRRHPDSWTDHSLNGSSAAPWRADGSRPPRLVWQQRIAGEARLDCRLEIDQGANGVLVHLSAAPASATKLAAGRVARIAVEVWCSSELATLVRDAEFRMS